MTAITAEMVREATAHLPMDMEAPQRWQWLADFLNKAMLHPTVPCVCCGVTPEGDVLDHLQPEQWAAMQPEAEPEMRCSYPDCNCPFDAPGDPNWCARGLPH